MTWVTVMGLAAFVSLLKILHALLWPLREARGDLPAVFTGWRPGYNYWSEEDESRYARQRYLQGLTEDENPLPGEALYVGVPLEIDAGAAADLPTAPLMGTSRGARASSVGGLPVDPE